MKRKINMMKEKEISFTSPCGFFSALNHLCPRNILSWWNVQMQSVGADVNQKLFKGFSITAAVREGHIEISKILLKAGASQPACEEALLEACCYGEAQLAKLLMDSDLVRPHISLHALVTACCRGFVELVDTLIKVKHLSDVPSCPHRETESTILMFLWEFVVYYILSSWIVRSSN